MITSTVWLILLLLPAFGFAVRGLDLVLRTKTKPNRVISTTGVIGAVSMFLFIVVGPMAVSAFRDIFTEFEINFAGVTEQVFLLNGLLLRLGLIPRCIIGSGLSACVLLFPELLCHRVQSDTTIAGKS